MKSRKTRLRANDVLETMLIERSLEVNPHLLNANKVVIVKGLVVPGFKHDRAGKPNSSAQGLRLVLSGRNNKEQ
jgi:hypothetical protein